MAYIESSLMMFRGESHKLLAASLPDENGKITYGTYGMVCRDGQIIWEILGRIGRQIVIPISRYKNVSDPWHAFTVVIDIDKGSYVLQGGVGQYYNGGFIVNDIGMMVIAHSNSYARVNSWKNLSVNGAVFYDPNYGRKLEGSVTPMFGMGDSFYGVGVSGYELENKLIKLAVNKHGMVEDEQIVDEIKGFLSAQSLKYKGSDTCILMINSVFEYYTYNLKNHALNRLNWSSMPTGLSWLTDGKFAYLRADIVGLYVVITSNFLDEDNVIYADVAGYYSKNTLYCRYPYVYIWRRNYKATSSSSYAFRIVKLNVVTGDSRIIEPDSIKIGDVTLYTKASDENGSPQTPYYRLYDNGLAYSNYNEYYEDGIMKDDLQGVYGTINATPSGHATDCYAVYMDNLELRPSEHNMTVYVCNF